MVAMSIPPVKIKTNGGFQAIICRIDPDDHDCLIGKIVDLPAKFNQGATDEVFEWDHPGLCRNGHDKININPSNDNIKKLLNIVDEFRKLKGK